ncbi:flagellin, partial [Klebsiella pneumoniae]|nr:flagellin [Klebsiella pneumoniae]
TFDGAGTGATNTDQALVDHINKNVNGVTASTAAVASATAAGTGVLADGESIRVTLANLDGTTTAIDIGGPSNNLSELVEKMNAGS